MLQRETKLRLAPISVQILSTLRVCLAGVICVWSFTELGAEEASRFDSLAGEFKDDVRPLLVDKCFKCHGEKEPEGDLNLAKFASVADIRRAPKVWQQVLRMLEEGDMPPEESPQLTVPESKLLSNWVRNYLKAEAKDRAGDPGQVVLRRLSNAELNYSIHDLTGVDLRPAAQFPDDSVAGEGFTNVGDALSMSSALLQKYVAAAEVMPRHAVLLADGIRFSPHRHRRDWIEDINRRIRSIYDRHSDQQGFLPLDRYFVAALKYREQSKQNDVSLEEMATESGLSPRYLRQLWNQLEMAPSDSTGFVKPTERLIYPIDSIRQAWRNASSNEFNSLVAETRKWQRQFWSIDPVTVSWYGRWQTEKKPIQEQQTIRLKIRGDEKSTVRLHLVTVPADSRKTQDKTRIRWIRPRFEGKDRPVIPLKALQPDLSFTGPDATDLLTDSGTSLELVIPREKIADHKFVVDVKLDNASTNSPIIQARVVQALPDWEDRAFARSMTFNGLPRQLPNAVGDKPAIQFAKGDDVMLGNSDQLRLPTFTITTVVNYDPDRGGDFRSIINNYHNPISWGKGMSLQLMRDGSVYFFTTAGTPETYSPMRSSEKISPGYHVISATYTSDDKRIYADGRLIGEEKSKGLDYGTGTKAAIGALREFGQDLEGDIAEIIVFHGVESKRRKSTESALGKKYNLPITHTQTVSPVQDADDMIESYKPSLWLSADRFVVAEKFEPSLQFNSKGVLIGGPHSRQFKEFEKQAAEFVDLFPMGLCFNEITPLNEGQITLRVDYREDEQLCRLILNDDEKAILDRAWEELQFVGRGAIREHESFDTFIGFTTQVSKEQTAQFEEFREPIRRRAERLARKIKASEPRHVESIIEFADRAWRRPLGSAEQNELRRFYQSLRESGMEHEESVRSLLSRVFLSPNFLYRIEEPKSVAEPSLVDDWELATRLSYFLWSSIPDKALRIAAAEGRLSSDTNQLDSQARRMLKDRRVRRLATEFACQWIGINDLPTFDGKNQNQYPNFLGLREKMHEEAVLFFTDLFRRDGSVLELIDCDHTFMDAALARHYGVDSAHTGWRRHDGMRQHSRGGLLTMSAVLTKQSGATRTSPVLRGNWIVETLLGERLPDPPPNVPELPDALPRAGKTVRQLTEQHVSDPACANCHSRIDPFGFSLESFDAIGRLRDTDLLGQRVDARAKLRDGTEFTGVDGLKSYLLNDRRDDFVRQFCRKLLGYALGRAVQLSDQLLIDEMVRKLKANNYQFSVAVSEIVRSQQFRMTRGMRETD